MLLKSCATPRASRLIARFLSACNKAGSIAGAGVVPARSLFTQQPARKKPSAPVRGSTTISSHRTSPFLCWNGWVCRSSPRSRNVTA